MLRHGATLRYLFYNAELHQRYLLLRLLCWQHLSTRATSTIKLINVDVLRFSLPLDRTSKTAVRQARRRAVRLASQSKRDKHSPRPQVLRTHYGKPNPLPPCSLSIPTCLVKQGMLHMLFQMGTEKQFLHRHFPYL